MKTEDERIAKPGILGSVIFIFIFILVLLWFGLSEDDPEGETREGGYGANDATIQPDDLVPEGDNRGRKADRQTLILQAVSDQVQLISRYIPDSGTKQA